MRRYICIFTALYTLAGMAHGQPNTPTITPPTNLRIEVTKRRDFAGVSYDGAGQEMQATIEAFIEDLGALSNGSGVVIQHEGKQYVLTNYHVIQYHDPDTISLRGVPYSSSDRLSCNLRFIGGDSALDIAFLEVMGECALAFTPYQWGDESRLKPNVSVSIPMPNRSKTGRGSLTKTNQLNPFNSYPGYLVHNVELERGDSGSGLVAEDGSLIGLNTLYTKNTANNTLDSYALGVSIIKRTLAKVIQQQPVRQYLGIEFGYHSTDGVFIKSILKGSPASYSMNPDCVGKTLRAINGRPVESLADVIRVLDMSDLSQVSIQIDWDCPQQPQARITPREFNDAALEQVGRHFAEKLGWSIEKNIYPSVSALPCAGKNIKNHYIRRVDVDDKEDNPIILAITSWSDMGKAVCAFPFANYEVGFYTNMDNNTAPALCPVTIQNIIFH